MAIFIKEMVEQLELPRTVVVENLFFSPRENTELVVGWYSRFRDDRNLPKQFALDELNDIKKRYEYFLNENPGLFTFLAKWKLKFQLGIDDGKGAYAACQEENGVVTWYASLAERPDDNIS